MKTLSKYSKYLVLAVIALGCAKQSADSGAGVPGTTPPPINCLPDHHGQVPPNCPVPTTASLNLEGDLLLKSEESGVQVIRNSPGTLERSYYHPFAPHAPSFRCSVGFSAVCEFECRNYRYGARIQVNIQNGNGQVRFKAGPYRSSGFMCSSHLNGSFYVVQFPTWVEAHSSGSGFTLKTVPSWSYGESLSIVVEQGSLTDTSSSYQGDVYYKGQWIGSVRLYRRI